MKRLFQFAVVGIIATEALVIGQGSEATRVLNEMRAALGGDKLAAVRNFIASGRSARSAGQFQLTGEFEIFCELPDKYVKKETISMGGMGSAASSLGFNGDTLLQESSAPGVVASGGGTMMYRVGPGGAAPGGASPTPEQQAAMKANALKSVKTDFTRLTVALFGASFSGNPVEFSYGGTAESPDGKADVIDVKGPNEFAARLYHRRPYASSADDELAGAGRDHHDERHVGRRRPAGRSADGRDERRRRQQHVRRWRGGRRRRGARRGHGRSHESPAGRREEARRAPFLLLRIPRRRRREAPAPDRSRRSTGRRRKRSRTRSSASTRRSTRRSSRIEAQWRGRSLAARKSRSKDRLLHSKDRLHKEIIDGSHQDARGVPCGARNDRACPRAGARDPRPLARDGDRSDRRRVAQREGHARGAGETPTKPVSADPHLASATGVATIDGLPLGRYTVQAEFPGFETVIVRDVRVRAGETKRSITLPIKKMSEDVTVGRDKQTAALDPVGLAFSTVLTREQIAALPDDPDEMEAILKAMAPPGASIRVDGFTGGKLPPKSQIRSIRLPRMDMLAAQNHGGLNGTLFIDIMTQPGIGPTAHEHRRRVPRRRAECAESVRAGEGRRRPAALRRIALRHHPSQPDVVRDQRDAQRAARHDEPAGRASGRRDARGAGTAPHRDDELQRPRSITRSTKTTRSAPVSSGPASSGATRASAASSCRSARFRRSPPTTSCVCRRTARSAAASSASRDSRHDGPRRCRARSWKRRRSACSTPSPAAAPSGRAAPARSTSRLPRISTTFAGGTRCASACSPRADGIDRTTCRTTWARSRLRASLTSKRAGRRTTHAAPATLPSSTAIFRSGCTRRTTSAWRRACCSLTAFATRLSR